ncbi:MAG: SH3 domain-containing protein, partial [Chloroflexota bacterium]|nr:SH3 domain-containing protein [Chloroflexota bacterium]
ATQAPSPLTPATPTPPAASSTPTSTPAPTTPTPTTRKFVVTNTDGDSVNLRDKPDSKTGKILTTVAEGTEVLVTGPTVNGDGNTWYPVQFGDKSGFMRAAYLTAAVG